MSGEKGNPDSFAVAIVDNDRLAIQALNMVIQRRLPHVRVLWSVTSGQEAVHRCLEALSDAQEVPALLLVDMSMETMGGPEVCREIRLKTTEISLVGMTSFSIDAFALSALRCGADCLVDKASGHDICIAISQLAQGERPTVGAVSQESPRECQLRLQQHVSAQTERRAILTHAECAVMDQLVLWKGTDEIAANLDISRSTVNSQISNAMQKLGVTTRTQAARKWMSINDCVIPMAGRGNADGAEG